MGAGANYQIRDVDPEFRNFAQDRLATSVPRTTPHTHTSVGISLLLLRERKDFSTSLVFGDQVIRYGLLLQNHYQRSIVSAYTCEFGRSKEKRKSEMIVLLLWHLPPPPPMETTLLDVKSFPFRV